MNPATKHLAAFLDAEHFYYRRFANDGPCAEETAIGSGWRMELDTPETPLTEQMARNFQTFCEKCMDVRLAATTDQSFGIVRWRITSAGGSSDDEFSRGDRSIEAFTLVVF